MKMSNGVLWDETGLRVEVAKVTGTADRFLKVSDLNPDVTVRRRLTRWDCARIGVLLLWRAVWARTPAQGG